ncbi:porphobilinogen synthase [Candidatus Marinamargulisbacteria bacterium SCGC AG-414-C22]|nr:porphobilinogen synthase [Candidatus Marinamargulisbacteria bacterium SCGC AG-414-C22]
MYIFENRPRRLRKNQAIRQLLQETQLGVHDFVYPIFVHDGQEKAIPIQSLPGCYRYSMDGVLAHCEDVVALGIVAVALFPAIDSAKKNADATEALYENGLIPQVIKKIKATFPDLLVVTDLALDPYSSDGHDGFVRDGKVLNDETVACLAQMAVLHASCGADIVAPSDMMDGRVGIIRDSLESARYVDTIILSYTAKYASALYGPFRDALQSAPKAGDKKTYQMNVANREEAIQEAQYDVDEGADILMVKPASWYLDIIRDLKDNFSVPIAGYHVSGEFSMLKGASQQGIMDYEQGLMEVLMAIKRAGASFIFTYGALDAARFLQKTN